MKGRWYTIWSFATSFGTYSACIMQRKNPSIFFKGSYKDVEWQSTTSSTRWHARVDVTAGHLPYVETPYPYSTPLLFQDYFFFPQLSREFTSTTSHVVSQLWVLPQREMPKISDYNTTIIQNVFIRPWGTFSRLTAISLSASFQRTPVLLVRSQTYLSSRAQSIKCDEPQRTHDD